MRGEILPELRWVYSESPEYVQRRLTVTFRDWHRAKLLGLEVEYLEIAGNKITGEELRRLNFWIRADGAWRSSALGHFESSGLLSDVLSGELGKNNSVGRAGGGRHANATIVPIRWFRPARFLAKHEL